MRPKLNQRVAVVSGPFVGSLGTVCRMLYRRSPESWVNLDERHPTACHPFPVDDVPGRGTHALIEWADMARPLG